MPKIKTLKFSLNGESIDLNIYCSKEGKFSAAIQLDIAETIGLKHNEIISTKLQDVESYFTNAFAAYNESKKELELFVGIRLRIRGRYALTEDGTRLEQIFQDNPKLYERESFISEVDGVCFDFRVIMQEKYCSSKTFYSACKYTGDPSLLKYDRYKDGYRSVMPIGVRDYDALIPYSEQVMNNLLSIQNQLKKASMFLATLVASENISTLLNGQNIGLLEE